MNEEQLLAEIADKGQLSTKEYLYIASFVREKAFLVFGTGRDTPYWKLINPCTTFLENKQEWLDPEDPYQYLVKYTTKISQSEQLMGSYHSGVYVNLEMKLPDVIREIEWDVIFVDSPEGYSNNTPGRMQSIYAASQLASPATDIFIHDVDRSVEYLWSSTLFSKTTKRVDRTAHLRL